MHAPEVDATSLKHDAAITHDKLHDRPLRHTTQSKEAGPDSL